MSGRDLNREILLNTIRADAANGTDEGTGVLHGRYPSLSLTDCEEIAETIQTALTTERKDKVSLVVTAPPFSGLMQNQRWQLSSR